MKARKPSQWQILSSCNEVRPDDGVDPRTDYHKPARRGFNRKARQLCSQIARTLNSVLAWESGDELLQGLVVASVEPAPDSTRMLVTILMQSSADDAAPEQVLAGLYRVAGKLRSEVAATIHRKRVPELVFRVAGGRNTNLE